MARSRSRRRRSAGEATVETIVQPSVRSYATFTPRQLRTALATADSGHMRTVADICEWVLADDRVKADIETRTSTLLGLDLTFEAGRGSQSQAAVKALEDGDWWKLFPEPELKKLHAWGLVAGISFGRMVDPEGVDEDSGRFVPHLETWHLRHFRQDPRTGQWLVRHGPNGEHESEVHPEDGWVIHCPYGTTRPWAEGLWRGLSRWVLLKEYAISDWGRHSENASRLFLEATVNASRDQRRELAADLKAAGKNQIVALPNGFKASLVEVSADTEKIYGKQIDAGNTGISIGVRGANLGTEVQGGSRAAAEVHERVDEKRTAFDAKSLRVTTRDHGLKPWASDNFGDPEAAPWPEYDTDPPEDQAANATIMKTLGEAANQLDKLGVELDWDEVGEQYGIPIKAIRERPDPMAMPKPEAGPEAPPGPDDVPDDPTTKPVAMRTPAILSKAAGYVEGQSYADALVDRGKRRGAEAMAPFLDSLEELIDGIEDLDDARDAIAAWFGDQLSPEEHAEKAERTFVLAQLAGVLAVRQDTPELETTDGDP